MAVAFPRSEVVLSTDPLRLARSPEERRMACAAWSPPSEEVIPVLAREPRVPPRPQREWHRIFGADE